MACAVSVLSACDKQKVNSVNADNSSIVSNMQNLKEVTPSEEYIISHSKYAVWDEATSVSYADLIAKVTLKSKKNLLWIQKKYLKFHLRFPSYILQLLILV